MSNEARLLFGGDFCPIRRYEEKILYGMHIFDDKLLNIFSEHDFFMINLESPLCQNNLKSAAPNGYGLRAAPEIALYLKRIKVNAVGLANNHIRDFLDKGVLETMNACEKAGLKYTGAGRNIKEAQNALNMKLKGIKITIWALAEREYNIATDTRAGSSVFNPELNVFDISAMKENTDILVIFVHAGHEFTEIPSPRIRSAYRRFIDAGANVVIGHHPHVPQGVENYKAGIICYSLGNLVFDSDYVSAFANTEIGFLVSIDINQKGISGFKCIPYKLGKDISVYSLESHDEAKFHNYIDKISRPLANKNDFLKSWRVNVAKRWEESFKRIMKDFSKRLGDESDSDLMFLRLARNFFTCPTHHEMFSEIFKMLEENILERN